MGITDTAELKVKTTSIKDFIAVSRADPTEYRNWNQRFRDAGYYSVEITPSNFEWLSIMDWCEDHVGKGHFAWTDISTFWFESQRDAVWFALNWS